MKPVYAAILCMACGFAGAGLVYLLQSTQPQQKQVATAPADDDARVARLEDEVSSLNAKIDDLLKLRAEPRSTPDSRKPDKTDAAPKDDATPKVADDTAKLKELSERLADLETGEAAARAMREKAIFNLNNGGEQEQEDAAMLLGKLAAGGDEAAKKALRDAMKSTDPVVREWAIEALNDTGLVEFLPELKALMNDPEPDVREEITQTLASMPADQAGPLLMAMLGDKEPDVLVGAIEVLGELEYKAAAADLLPLTRHADEEVALEAAIAMRHCGDSSAAENLVPTLGAKLSSTDADERRRTVRTLRRISLESARPYLEQALNDADQRVRREAERALAELNE
jgi:HEAT repeat protein